MSKLEEEQGGPTESVILCGIETQACIFHTVMDLLERGDINVHVVADCCSSRKGKIQISNDLSSIEVFLTSLYIARIPYTCRPGSLN